jgi:hypothetical protein
MLSLVLPQLTQSPLVGMVVYSVAASPSDTVLEAYSKDTPSGEIDGIEDDKRSKKQFVK